MCDLDQLALQLIYILKCCSNIFLNGNRSLLWLAVYKAKEAQPRNWQVPEIRILVRDFHLQIANGQSPDDYLSEHLESAEANSRVINTTLWNNRRCNVLPMPHIQSETFTNEAQRIFCDITENNSSNSMNAWGNSKKKL